MGMTALSTAHATTLPDDVTISRDAKPHFKNRFMPSRSMMAWQM